MKVHYCFDEIVEKKFYNIQGTVIHKISFWDKHENRQVYGRPINSPSCHLKLIIIIEDVNKKRIECIAFGSDAEYLEQTIQENEIYEFKYVRSVINLHFYGHKFKLLVELRRSEITKLNIQLYYRNGKQCVKANKISKKNHQTTIKNWLH